MATDPSSLHLFSSSLLYYINDPVDRKRVLYLATFCTIWISFYVCVRKNCSETIRKKAVEIASLIGSGWKTATSAS